MRAVVVHLKVAVAVPTQSSVEHVGIVLQVNITPWHESALTSRRLWFEEHICVRGQVERRRLYLPVVR